MCVYCRLSVSYSTCATAIVIPRSRSSGALSIDPYSRTAIVLFFVCSTFVIAAVNVVLPWSMCPIVPTFTCGLVRSNFCLAMSGSPCAGLAGRPGGAGLAGDLRHDLLGDGPRHFLVAGELHGVGGPPLGHGANVGGVAEHLTKRHEGPDHLGAGPRFHRDDLAPAAVEVADHRALVLDGADHLDVHHRLEQHRLGLPAPLLEAHGGGDLEGHLVAVDLVVA